ncbi:short-chain dehydrogenase/reductase family 16C member 6-like [Kogia breviceps]|uniref:short-chain dehydrogenase/reductase family 16C member 6-like n=1 Tax=Kogia breviceps TaxID=27615 RepID=UPI002795765B|nr:short-chain dehydrogenase/reductase family 16C member 6-like [Kogia breviceps]
MNTILDTSMFWGKFLYYFLESLVYRIIPKKKKNVAGEIVLITGAGSGLGRLLAITSGSLGAILVLWDINEEGNMETRPMTKEKGDVKVFAYTCNYFKAFLPAMLKANHGHLVCISSIAGVVSINGLSDYCASKFAAFGFSESLYLELRLLQKSNVTATIVCPYFINTGMFDGCATRDPLLLPILGQEHFAQKVSNAILEEQVYSIMPTFLHVALLLKQEVNHDFSIILVMCEQTGMDTSVASLTGQEKAGEVQTENERTHL